MKSLPLGLKLLLSAVRGGKLAAFLALAVGAAPPALAQAPSPAKAKPAAAKSCKTFTAGMVFFGEETTRADAVKQLDKDIAEWKDRTGNVKAREIKRAVKCEIYLKALNEYECTAEAVLCR